MNRKEQLKFVLVTPVFIILSHYLAVFPHEYMHSFTAWILGYKSNPLLLNYGGFSWQNLLYLDNIDENVEYLKIYHEGHGYIVALIAFAGSGIGNSTLFIISKLLLNQYKKTNHVYLYYFLFWFNLMNLGNFYDYVPIRTFSNHGDVYIFTTGLNISPWVVNFVFGYLVCFLIWNFFTRTLIDVYKNLEIKSSLLQSWIMSLSAIILFGYFGRILSAFASSNHANDPISYFLSITSFMLIPIIIIACWPTRLWVQLRFS